MRPIIQLYKNSFSGLSAASWWLSIVIMINRCGTMVVPFMTLYLTQSLHYSIGKASIVFAMFGLGAIAGGFLGGQLAGRLGFYNIQLVTLCCGGVMFFVLSFIQSFWLLCVCTFILSVVNDAFRPANSMAIAHYSKPENRTRSYSLNRLAINLGWALGGSLGGFLAAHNYHWLFYIDGGTNIAAAIMLRIALAPAKQAKPKEVSVKKEIAPRFAAYKDARYLWFCAFVILYAYAFFQWFSTLPVYYRETMHLSEKDIGLTMAVNGIIIALVEMILIFRLEGTRHPLHFIKYGSALVTVCFLLFNLLNGGLWLALGITLIVTFGEMLSMPFMNTYWVGRTNDSNRGQYAGLYTVSWSIAQVLGPFTGGQIAQTWGFKTLWWIMVGVSLAATVGFWLLQKQPIISNAEK